MKIILASKHKNGPLDSHDGIADPIALMRVKKPVYKSYQKKSLSFTSLLNMLSKLIILKRPVQFRKQFEPKNTCLRFKKLVGNCPRRHF